MSQTTVNIAVEGCCHGDLDRIFTVLEEADNRKSVPTDFMICCGDFQAIRTEYVRNILQLRIFCRKELETLACPPVYRHMKDFHRYWKEEKVARCLTLFVGGNHEAPGHLREMYFGGYAAQHIFYLGSCGVFNVCGLRIAGLSGIFKGRDFDKPIFESPPYSEDTKRSAYHVRRVDIEKLLLIEEPVDIVVTHDWPTGITDHGDTESMLRKKDKTGQLRQELNSGEFGNPFQMEILKKLKPKFWFSGHMHIKYPAIYVHENGEITRFLALDKCIPYRPFLQMVGIDRVSKEMVGLATDSGKGMTQSVVELDVEWMAILKKNNEFLPIGRSARFTSGSLVGVCEEDKSEMRNSLRNHFGSDEYVVPYFGQVHPGDSRYRKWFCDVLGVRDRMEAIDQVEIPVYEPAPTHDTGEADALFFLDS